MATLRSQSSITGLETEAKFLALVCSMGLQPLLPYGASQDFDLGVSTKNGIKRVQVKGANVHTDKRWRHAHYAWNKAGGNGRGRGPETRFNKEDFDIAAFLLIGTENWLCIPSHVLHGAAGVSVTPSYKKSKWHKYLNAWHHLTDSPLITTPLIHQAPSTAAAPGFDCSLGPIATEAMRLPAGPGLFPEPPSA